MQTSLGQDEIAKGVVTTASLSVRQIPDNGAHIVGALSNDSEVRILAEQGDWLRIRFDDDDGYVEQAKSSGVPRGVRGV